MSDDSRSVGELFAAATDWTVGEGDGDWDAVRALRFLGTREVFERAVELTKDDDPRIRAQGASILNQLGIPDRVFPDECEAVLTGLIEKDRDAEVIDAAIYALGHLRRATTAIVKFVDYPDEDIRFAVAFALGGRSEPEAVAALITLTQDAATKVRDWATFGLGEIGEANTPEIREALSDRLDDTDDDTRFEAICGLARCGDSRAGLPLIEALRQAPDDLDLFEAATRLLKRDYPRDVPVEVLIDDIRRLSAEQQA